LNNEYFEIRDNCRKGLLKYLSKALTMLPIPKEPKILDVGCGTGVPTLLLTEKFKGHITATDTDTISLNRLKKKIVELNLTDRISVMSCSLFDIEKSQFDLIIAEGLLNVVSFQKGFLRMLKLLKRNRFLIIHDEYRNQNEKIKFIERNNCKLLDSFVLNEQIWWNDYYKCLEEEISSESNKRLLKLFKPDMQEIDAFRKDSSQFKSVYFVIEKM